MLIYTCNQEGVNKIPQGQAPSHTVTHTSPTTKGGQRKKPVALQANLRQKYFSRYS